MGSGTFGGCPLSDVLFTSTELYLPSSWIFAYSLSSSTSIVFCIIEACLSMDCVLQAERLLPILTVPYYCNSSPCSSTIVLHMVTDAAKSCLATAGDTPTIQQTRCPHSAQHVVVDYVIHNAPDSFAGLRHLDAATRTWLTELHIYI